MIALLKSRKFKLTAAAVLGAVALALNGEVTWAQALVTSVMAIMANVFGIAIEDGAAKAAGGVK